MYTFAITVLLGLALFTVVDATVGLAPGTARVRSLVTLILAVLGVFALDYSLFEGFGVRPREEWLGLLLTGAVVAGTATAWEAVLHWLGSPEGEDDEARRPRRRLVTKAA